MTFVLLLAAALDPATIFLNSYCTSCHGEKAQMANRRFDRGPLAPADLLAVSRRVESGTMPPRSPPNPPLPNVKPSSPPSPARPPPKSRSAA